MGRGCSSEVRSVLFISVLAIRLTPCFVYSLLVWGAVILITALSYATGLRGDESGTASNSTIEKAFDAGPGGALSLFLTTVVLAPLLEETVFRGFM